MNDPRGILEEFAERAAWEVSFAELAGGYLLDQRLCRRVEERHLGFNRYRHNPAPDRRRLTEAQVRALRKSSETDREAADRLGISKSAVHKIRSRQTYRDVA